MGDNIFATGMAAFGDAYDQQNKMRTDRAQVQAGRQLAAGNYGAGAATLNSAGMIDAGHNVIADQQQLQDRQANSDALEAKRKATALIDVAQSLKQVPPGQRQAALQSKLPIFQSLKIDTAPFQSLDEAHLTDDQLDQFSTALGKAADEYTLGEGQTRYVNGKPVVSGPPKRDYKEVTNADGSTSFIDLNAQGGPTGGTPAPAAAPQAAASPSSPGGTAQPRGLRNNNPLNLTSLPHGQWDGQTGSDGKYAVFSTPEQGLTAADKNLQAYATHHGINTISGVISRWAPSNENDTNAYIGTVSKALGVDANTPLNLTDPNVRMHVLGAMARVELGKALPTTSGPAQVQPAAAQGLARIPGSAPGTKTLAGEDDVPLTKDAVDLLAGKYLNNGQLPPMGMGKTGTRNRAQVLNRATEMAKGLGLDANDLVAGSVSVKAAGQALGKATSIRMQVEASEQTVLKNAQNALSLADQLGGQTRSPVINRWIQAGRKEVAGDPQVAAFQLAIKTVADEYAKVMTTSTGTGGTTTESALAEAHRRIDGAMNAAQLRAVVAQMKVEMDNRAQSQREAETGLRTLIRNGGRDNPQGQSPPDATSAPGGRPPLSSFIKGR